MENTRAVRAEAAYRAEQLATFQQQCDALERHDLDAMVSVYAEDVHYEEKTARWDLHGRDEVRDQFGPWFAATSKLGMDLLDSVHDTDRAAFIFRWTGTLLSGHRFDFFSASQSTYDAVGEIKHEVAVWNLAELPEQAARDMGFDVGAAYRPFTEWAANGRGTAAAKLASNLQI